MADMKKRGFHALEERIHQMEEDDAKKAPQNASAQQPEAPRTAAPQGEREQPKRK